MNKIAIDEILQPRDDATQKLHAKKVKLRFWEVIKKAANHIPFIEEVLAAYYCAFDPATPKRERAVLLAALAYFVMPFDAIPDFLTVIGFTDDIAVLTIALTTMHAHITDLHREAARKTLGKTIKTSEKV